MQRYEGKQAVVTGGTTGIGLATVQALLAGGAEVLLTGRDERHLDAARRTLGPRAHVVRSDTSSLADIAALGSIVQETLGGVDLVFLNAGYAKLLTLAQSTEDEYERTFAVNTRGAYFTARRLAPLVRAGGSLVFTTSIADASGTPGMSLYSGAKAAVRSFVRVLAAELVARQIRVNAVSPGFVKTPSMGVHGATPEELAAFEREGDHITPMKRIGTPEEIARAALFLAFEATFTTGAELPVDGGLSQLSV